MEKTITAIFESVDTAALTARRVASHFDHIRSIRISYPRPGTGAREGYTDSVVLPFGGNSSVSGTGAGTGVWYAAYPSFAVAGTIAVGDSGRRVPDGRERACVRVTAEAGEAGRIAAALRTGGGWDVRTV